MAKITVKSTEIVFIPPNIYEGFKNDSGTNVNYTEFDVIKNVENKKLLK